MKTLLVHGDKTFKITVPDDAKITFGPWSPPRTKSNGYTETNDPRGTLRIYQGTKDNIIACFAGVHGFRDLTMKYAEEIAREEGATLWKDDEEGYVREHKVHVSKNWIEPDAPALVAHNKKKPGRARA